MEVRRGPTLALLTLALLASCNALDAAPSASDMPSGAKPPEPMERKPNFLLRTVQRAIVPPITAFREAPPITRSWVSASVLMAVLASQRAIDLRSICFSERDVIYKGEWWRLLVNFFYMGDSVKSLFFWFQLHQFWECLKVLELVKYRWEPGDFIKMIVCNGAMLLVLKQLFPQLIFLGSPMVMAFVYMYSREYEVQVMNLLGFFQIRCGWLPFAQSLQDLIQAGDMSPNLLGMLSGHTYFYSTEVASRMLLPERTTLDDVMKLLVHGTPLDAADEALGGEAASEGGEAATEGDDGGEAAAEEEQEAAVVDESDDDGDDEEAAEEEEEEEAEDGE